jgi:hypothetical protein
MMTPDFNSDRVAYLLRWLELLSNGHVKPHKKDLDDPCCNHSYTVRDSNKFMELINGINKELKSELSVSEVHANAVGNKH